MNEAEIRAVIREERNKYAREWRRKNPGKVRANNERYWQRKAMAIIAANNEEKK